MNNDHYWSALISNALRYCQEQNKADVVTVIKNSSLVVELNNHDNWNGGIDYWDIVFQVKYKDYIALGDRISKIETDLLEILDKLHTEDGNIIANVLVRPKIEQYIDWNAILPATKDSLIQLIKGEQKTLTDIATGVSYKEHGLEQEYQERHLQIIQAAKKAGFDYPINANSLAEWWIEIREISGYADRRAYISKVFSELLKMLNESEDTIDSIDFSSIATRSGTIQKAIDDAEVFIRDGKFDSAVDRVHTAFHGYLRQLLSEHSVTFESDDSLTSLYAKLHAYYGNEIKPSEVGNRIKAILRSASGMMNAVNELRNNNTIAHPNGQLIQAREARLVIRLVNTIVDYIEEVEKDLNRSVLHDSETRNRL